LILALIGAGLFLASLAPNVSAPNLEARIRGFARGDKPAGAAAPPPPPPAGGTGGFGGTSGTTP